MPDVSLLMDTGADITLLPREAVERLGVPLLSDQQYELMGFDGAGALRPLSYSIWCSCSVPFEAGIC